MDGLMNKLKGVRIIPNSWGGHSSISVPQTLVMILSSSLSSSNSILTLGEATAAAPSLIISSYKSIDWWITGLMNEWRWTNGQMEGLLD